MLYQITIPNGFTPEVIVSKDKVVVKLMIEDYKFEPHHTRELINVLNFDKPNAPTFTDKIEEQALKSITKKAVDGILSGECNVTLDTIKQEKLDEVNVKDFVEIEGLNIQDIQPKINGFAFSERGDIAFLKNGECLVILTYKGEIQLNQTCNFGFTRPATVEEIIKLTSALMDQKALMIKDDRVQPWKPWHNEKYHSFSSSVSEYTYMGDVIDKECMVTNNMFPIGFITEERKNQYFETVSKLFDSWRE